MSAAGERDGFDREDVLRFADNSELKKNPASRVIDQVGTAVRDWPRFAVSAGVDEDRVRRIGVAHRLRSVLAGSCVRINPLRRVP